MSDDMCYVALHSCGNVVGVTADSPESRRSNGKYIKEWLNAGYSIDKWTIEKFRAEAKFCKCNRIKNIFSVEEEP